MRSTLRFFGLIIGITCLSSSLFAQTVPTTWADVILEEKGDTVVVKPSSEAPGYLNTMYYAIMGDTTATGERTNLNRVYETVRGGHYIYDGPAIIDATVPQLRIVAQPGTDLPPIHYKTLDPTGELKNGYFKMYGPDFYMENQFIEQAVLNDTRERKFWGKVGDSARYEFNNCVIDMSNWAWLNSWSLGSTYKITNCLIMNIGREGNLEKGPVMDGPKPWDTVWFENNTILNCGNVVTTRPSAAPNFFYFNHNTVVNSTNNPFLFFSQAEQITTNNIFVNTGIVPDYPDFYGFYQDDDKLPKGIINVDTIETAWIDKHWGGNYPMDEADRKILVDRNSVSWDQRFTEMFNNDLAPMPDTITEVWASQEY